MSYKIHKTTIYIINSSERNSPDYMGLFNHLNNEVKIK